MHRLDAILATYRESAVTEREKGTYFERLVRAYLENDPVQVEEHDQVLTYAEWAQEHGRSGKDTGIDLVARLRNEEGYAAIQCKLYKPNYRIQKKDLDSFLSASGKSPFVRRVFVDSTLTDWSSNAEDTIRGQSIPVIRIGLEALRESRIDWAIFQARDVVELAGKKSLRPHQSDARDAVREGLDEADRGKVIMACGTGKTFTSLKIAEDLVGAGGRVLYMVPSLALMSQTVREWTSDSEVPLRSFAVCSDSQVGKHRKAKDDIAEIEAHDLAFPATTDPKKLFQKASREAPDRMTVVFSTYQSIQVLSEAQKAGLPDFNLIICDEAHRTTGATLDGEESSNFVRIHDDAHVRGRKRIYMTATPRIFGEVARDKAKEASVELCSMDDEALFGKTLFERGFSWAVENDLLTDYKVIVLAMDEAVVSDTLQKRLAEANELKLDDATKIIGCYKALAKDGLRTDLSHDPEPMKRAIAFCRDIRSSKMVTEEFAQVVKEFRESGGLEEEGRKDSGINCTVQHVDGTYNAKARGELLNWLSEAQEADECRILSNARCLSEGVDVPALDAILFMHPRKSQIDVVQSVGRVMRRDPSGEKKLGYVILPVGIPANVAPEDALRDNERYRVVWQILNALRAHDDRFEATINRMDLESDSGGQIEIVAVTDHLPGERQPKEGPGIGTGTAPDDYDPGSSTVRNVEQRQFIFDELPAAIRAKIVEKCGRRTYWEDWAKDITNIAQAHITRIRSIVDSGDAEREIFDEFLKEIQDDLNDGVTEDEAIEMLAQHLITRPVFNALFEDYDFARENPVSQAMQTVLDVIEPKSLDKEAESLEGFYASVRRRVEGVKTDEAKQKIIVELYDKFFRTAFPRMTERLGIVYTPVEIVDFINRSVDEVLRSEFGQTLGSEGVHIIDPFTGTGTFITRLIQSGLIDREDLSRKYRGEIHANEIVLLAYYIAAINIEAAYHSVMGGDYHPFEGICLTDTFQMYESEDLIAQLMPDNSERRRRQKSVDIKVIVGNPPYSIGQQSEQDNAANQKYPELDSRISQTYAAASSGSYLKALYDSYVRAIRWGSDRLGESGGVLAYVSNAGWIEGNAMDGLRKCLREEFSSLYVFNLRGNQRTSGETSRKEGGKIFGSGSRTPVAISVLVKKPEATGAGQIYYHDIGDYLSREEKLAIIQDFGSVTGLQEKAAWTQLEPDEHHDWINQGDRSFGEFTPMGDKQGAEDLTLFANYSLGVATNRDAWCYNFSRTHLERNIKSMIAFYNKELARYKERGRPDNVNSFVSNDSKSIAWTDTLKKDLKKELPLSVEDGVFMQSMYRPFTKEWLFFGRRLNQRVYQMPRLFPDPAADNLAITVTGIGAKGFSALMVSCLPDLQLQFNGQALPLFLYDAPTSSEDGSLFEEGAPVKHAAISAGGLDVFRAAYPGEQITREDLFYYIYGILHSEDYRTRFGNNLSKALPRIPAVKDFSDFQALSQAGRELAKLHINYESVEPYPVSYKQGDTRLWVIENPESFYRVKQMKFAGKRPNLDRSTVIYNTNITMTGVPLEAYDYVVNGKPALAWVMERQAVTTDKKSGITNDANRYAVETVGNPAYPLELFQRVITVSLKTMKIVRDLPKLDISK